MVATSRKAPSYTVLVDEEGNPVNIGGNPKPDSITTEMIKDGAVTDAKLAKPKVDVPDPLIAQTVIGTNFSGQFGIVGYSQDPRADQLVMYQFGGQVSTAAPTDDTHAATKKYVDDQIAALAARVAALEGGGS